MKKIGIVLHGGAGTIDRSKLSAEMEKSYLNALEVARNKGFEILSSGKSALEAVEAAVMELEDCPLFNAGKGSVFTFDKTHEMDASIMNGKTLAAGSVAGISHVKNPVALARRVMENSDHVMLFGKGAEDFALEQGLKIEDDHYFFNELRYNQWKEAHAEGKVRLDHSEKKFGTVGAACLDMNGNLAAATSTGGMTNKRWGRIGDSPVIGSGTYANNKTCAISCTGHGEYFLRAVVAYDISCLIEYKGMTLSEACEFVVMDKLVKLGGEGGLVAIDSEASFSLPFNSSGMYRAWKTSEAGKEGIAIYR